MLSESSYMTALYVYISAAIATMLYLAWWLSRHWRPATVALCVLLAGALLLTPAYPREGVETLAPALIVAAFQLMTEGLDGAMHALRPLAFISSAAIVLALLLRFSLFRNSSKPARSKASKPAHPA